MPNHIIISNYSTYIGKKSERLVVREKDKAATEIPFFDVEQITIETTGVSFSSDVVRECCERGIPINFLSSTGKPYAKITSPELLGTVATRREQLLAYNDGRGIDLAKAFIEGKLKNQANLLKYFAKYRKDTARVLYGQIMDTAASIEEGCKGLKDVVGLNVEELRGQLLAVEGHGANLYWQAVQLLIGDKIDFPGREHRGAPDPVNSLLNYGYGMLYHQVWSAATLAGLDPFAGYLHADRAGKPSLILDLIEEFRQPVVDRVVLALVNQGVNIKMDGEFLCQEAKKTLAHRVLERLGTAVLFRGKKHKLGHIIQIQARNIASFVRGEGKYKPFISGW